MIGWKVELPQGLKPVFDVGQTTRLKAVPFQNRKHVKKATSLLILIIKLIKFIKIIT